MLKSSFVVFQSDMKQNNENGVKILFKALLFIVTGCSTRYYPLDLGLQTLQSCMNENKNGLKFMLNHSCSVALQDAPGQQEVQAEVQVEIQAEVQAEAPDRLGTTSELAARPVDALQATFQPEEQILSGFRWL